MKKMIVLLVVMMLAFGMVLPASAAGNGPGSGNGTGTSGPVPASGPGPSNGPGSGTGSGSGQAQQGTRGTFAITGTIAAIGTNSITVDVVRGNKLVQAYLGTQLTVTVTPRTRYLDKDGTTTTTIAFGDLAVGQPVSINGTVANDVWTAVRITVGAALTCLP